MSVFSSFSCQCPVTEQKVSLNSMNDNHSDEKAKQSQKQSDSEEKKRFSDEILEQQYLALIAESEKHLKTCKDKKSDYFHIDHCKRDVIVEYNLTNPFTEHPLLSLDDFFDPTYKTLMKISPNCIKSCILMTKTAPFAQTNHVSQIVLRLMQSFSIGALNNDIRNTQLNQIGNICLTVKDCATLTFDTCINDSIIDASLHLFNERCFNRSKNSMFDNIKSCNLACNTNFWKYVENYSHANGSKLIKIVQKKVEYYLYISIQPNCQCV